ncbi:MAG: glutathione binding-like protein [Pseudomonadales bacterium]|jgi:GST-like protein|nr:glutathione binding-like protein [Pseudomonadales bacterium]MDP6472407.1 glutathione binding-like protein [Pseudomonadales bacterium]MDP6828203.1 glutathione binding-like protein [Pseudomonadales bacterium]|tara:strand:+ start:7306 stop:8040 length:735 start_codon:yes stop_codon:yes gene_type:complete
MIDLHYWPTPNGKKVTIQLEEMGVEYNLVPCRIGQGDQFTDEFIAMNPNTRMPAMIDNDPECDGGPLSVFESGAIMIYLGEKFGQFYPRDPRSRHAINQWIMWQMANQGPKTGELGHFRRLPESEGNQSYAIRRFDDEVNRIYGVLNRRLYEAPYLAGNEYSIADMCCYPWAVDPESRGQDIGEFPHVARWLDELAARPAVQRGMDAGAQWSVGYGEMPPEERERIRKMLYNQRARPVPELPAF